MKNKYKGKFIVIEGIDGSGKATQTKLLIKRLKKMGRKTATLDFPQYYNNFFGKTIGRFQNGEFGNAPKTSPYLASVLYAADRWEAKNKIEKWLKNGKTVVLDRYASSNQIHQGGKFKNSKEKKKFFDWLEEMEFEVFKIPKPDLVIFLDVPYQTTKKLMAGNKEIRKYIKNSKKDKVEKNRAYQEASYRQLLNLVKRYKNWAKVNCLKNGKLLKPEEINDLVWEKVEKFI